MIEERVRELKEIIASNDGHNAADSRFTRAVDELMSAVYDDIGRMSALPARTLFDLFVIKVLYVGRHSVDAGVIEYLGAMLETCLLTRELFPPDDEGRPRRLYFSDMLEPEKRPHDIANVFEAYRRYADSALFLSGIFPTSLQPPRAARRTCAGARDPASMPRTTSAPAKPCTAWPRATITRRARISRRRCRSSRSISSCTSTR